MRRLGIPLLVAPLLCALAASPANAKEWAPDYDHSFLGFTGTQGETKFEGHFKKFEVHIDFDTDKPETGKIAAKIAIASVTAGSDERDSALPAPEWFDAAQFPEAQFLSTDIKAAACGQATPPGLTNVTCYKAAGTLTVKGISKPITLDFLLGKEGDHMRAQAKAKLLRTDFGVGLGPWADETYVKRAVDLTIDIVARQAS